MPDTRKVVIEIVSSDEEERKDQPDVEQASDKNGKTKEGKQLLSNVVINQAVSTAKRIVSQAVETGLSMSFQLTENYLAENTYNNAKTVINKVVSNGTVMTGALLTGNPIIVGITAIGLGVSETITRVSRMSGYYQSLNASRIQTDYLQRRAGLYDGAKGTEN